jgi:hypothetical protein
MGATTVKAADTTEAMLLRAEDGLRECVEQGGNRLVLPRD